MSVSSLPDPANAYGCEEARAFAQVLLRGNSEDARNATINFLLAMNSEFKVKSAEVTTEVNEASVAVTSRGGDDGVNSLLPFAAAIMDGLSPLLAAEVQNLSSTTEETEEQLPSVPPKDQPDQSPESAPESAQELAIEPTQESASESAPESGSEPAPESAGSLIYPEELEEPPRPRRLVRLPLRREAAFIGDPDDLYTGPLYGRTTPLPEHGPYRRPPLAWPYRKGSSYRARTRSPDAADIKERAKHIKQLLGSGLQGRLPSLYSRSDKDGIETGSGDSSSIQSCQTSVTGAASSPASSVAPSPVSFRKRSREPEDEEANAPSTQRGGTPFPDGGDSKSATSPSSLRDDGHDSDAAPKRRKISTGDLSDPSNPEPPARTLSRKRSREAEDDDANVLPTTPESRTGISLGDHGNSVAASSFPSLRDDGRDSTPSPKRRKIATDRDEPRTPKSLLRSSKPRAGRPTRSYTMPSYKTEE